MKHKHVLWIGDWFLNKNGEPITGYGNISDVYCRDLFDNHVNLLALGFAYARNQHNYYFSLTQTPMQYMGVAIQSINSSYGLDYIVACCDIPIQKNLLKVPRGNTKYIGIFAVESSPLYAPWAMDIATMDYPLAISEFGKQECIKAGVNAEHLIIPVDSEKWKSRTLEEKQNIKDVLGVGDRTVLFVNAAGNERKNLSTILETMRDLKDDPHKYYLYMLTNLDSQVSWDLKELVTRFDIGKNVTLIDKGLSVEETRRLYAGADFFINISKAEGMCYPILEAQSVGVPVIATYCTAMKEHIQNGRGIAIDADFVVIDPFGNTDRFYVIHETLTATLKKYTAILDENPHALDTILANAQEYIKTRNAQNSRETFRKLII